MPIILLQNLPKNVLRCIEVLADKACARMRNLFAVRVSRGSPHIGIARGSNLSGFDQRIAKRERRVGR